MRKLLLIAVLMISAPYAFAGEGSIDEEVTKIDALAAEALANAANDELRALYQADLDFSADARERHVSDAFADRFLEDGMTFSNGRAPVVGPEAIREAMKDGEAIWRWAPVAGKVDGDLGVTWGRAFLYVPAKDDAEPRTFRSRYVTVWERDEDGEWKIWIDLGTEASDEEF